MAISPSYSLRKSFFIALTFGAVILSTINASVDVDTPGVEFQPVNTEELYESFQDVQKQNTAKPNTIPGPQSIPVSDSLAVAKKRGLSPMLKARIESLVKDVQQRRTKKWSPEDDPHAQRVKKLKEFFKTFPKKAGESKSKMTIEERSKAFKVLLNFFQSLSKDADGKNKMNSKLNRKAVHDFMKHEGTRAAAEDSPVVESPAESEALGQDIDDIDYDDLAEYFWAIDYSDDLARMEDFEDMFLDAQESEN